MQTRIATGVSREHSATACRASSKRSCPGPEQSDTKPNNSRVLYAKQWVLGLLQLELTGGWRRRRRRRRVAGWSTTCQSSMRRTSRPTSNPSTTGSFCSHPLITFRLPDLIWWGGMPRFRLISTPMYAFF
jgi:hypothetical protein